MKFKSIVSKLVSTATSRFAKPKLKPLSDLQVAPDFGGTRTSISKGMQSGATSGVLPKKVQRELSLDDTRFSSMTVGDMIDALIDAHPDVSYAVWNFLRIGNTPFKVEVYKLGSGKRWTQGEKDLQEMLENMELPNVLSFEKTRGMKKTINQLLLSVITRGAAAVEAVISPKGDTISFFAPVDPVTIDFKLENGRFVPYQKMQQLSLDLPTFFYEGLDEKIDDPYGRSPIVSALNIVVFQLQVLNDIKAVVHNHGYPRIDIKIIEEVLIQRMPITVRANEEKKQKWLADRIDEIVTAYSNLNPDDAFIHFDSVEIDSKGGGGGGGAMIDPEKLMTVIDNLIMTGLKTLSTLLGRRSSGNTESFAKLETKIYIKGVEAIQDVVASVLSKALTLALNIRGKQGIVKFKFEAIEIRTELEQEQFKTIQYQNIAYMRDQGWIDQNTASQMVTGTDAVAEPNYDVLGKGGSKENKDGKPTQPTSDTNPSAGGSSDASSGN